MRSAAAFAVPRPDPTYLMSDAAKATMPTFDSFVMEVAQWVDRVNQRAGRNIVTSTAGIVRLATSGSVVKEGSVLIVIDGIRTQPSTFITVDRMEFLA